MTVQVESARRPWTKAVMGAILAVPALAGVFWDEVLLAGPIVFLVNFFGFWLGYVIFCLVWAGIGILALSVWLRVEPWVREHILGPVFGLKHKEKMEEKAPKTSWRDRVVNRLARIARILGALAAAVLLGSVFGWAVFKGLGYKEKEVYVLTFISAWIFGGIWVPFYGIGVWGLGLSRLL